ncbi:30S ribosomal protein S4 [Isachenkonia alkalipeptolytica]|uniref:Small ribosomal subunit protein uS4 n=1 Tax=Isachenkonia alkalipeptolytica TaxID=2565777 RepID=A0AA44BCD7_9CLOT|nr:30S ribosomal protein S4 [Isachenkonia alkalipeptolytica]NBG87269.1 30S ribosomal protein S4 [Isachenkonia alkalipeptolytica]
MARNLNPRFKESRRLGVNIYGHPKAMDRYRKGMGRGDKKLSTYGEQLLQKQRLKAYYGVLEKQMRRYMDEAKKSADITGDQLVRLLETRLDNMVYRMGFASSIRQARQMVVHRHIQLNGKRVDRPSHRVSIGDQVTLKESSRDIESFNSNFRELKSHPSYISRDVESFTASLTKSPDREEIPVEVNDHLVVEYYTAL